MKIYILTKINTMYNYTDVISSFSTLEKAEEACSIINHCDDLDGYIKYEIDEYELDYIPEHPNQGMLWWISYKKSSGDISFYNSLANPWDWPNKTFSLETSIISSERRDEITITCWAKTKEEAEQKVLSFLSSRTKEDTKSTGTNT